MKGSDFINNLILIFGSRIGNALLRNGIQTVEDLKKYCLDHPYYSNRSAYIWRGVGDISYRIIDKYLEEL